MPESAVTDDDAEIGGEPWPGTELLKKLMDQRGWSAPQLAIAAGLGQDYVRNIVRGRSKAPRLEGLRELARVLDVPVAVLTGDEPPPPPPQTAARPPRRRRGYMLSAAPMVDEAADDEAAREKAAAPRGFVRVPALVLRGTGGTLAGQEPVATLVLPAGPLAIAGADPQHVVAVQAPGLGLPPDVLPSTWVLVDTARTELSRGLLRGKAAHLIWDGEDYALGRVYVEAGKIRGQVGEENLDADLMDLKVVGRVILVLRNM
jgi:transcriptional regulator with XRE-family HTH domain